VSDSPLSDWKFDARHGWWHPPTREHPTGLVVDRAGNIVPFGGARPPIGVRPFEAPPPVVGDDTGAPLTPEQLAAKASGDPGGRIVIDPTRPLPRPARPGSEWMPTHPDSLQWGNVVTVEPIAAGEGKGTTWADVAFAEWPVSIVWHCVLRARASTDAVLPDAITWIVQLGIGKVTIDLNVAGAVDGQAKLVGPLPAQTIRIRGLLPANTINGWPRVEFFAGVGIVGAW